MARATGRCFCWASERRCAGSELVALSLGDIETVPGRGLRILVRRSKTDQQGQEIAIWANPDQPGFCPLAAVDARRVHPCTAADLDWTASVASRPERPPFCAVSKTGRVTGEKLSDKTVASQVTHAVPDVLT